MDETTNFRELIESAETPDDASPVEDIIVLEAGCVYIKVSPGTEGFNCEVYDRLNQDETGMMLACITRGMVEYAMIEPEKLIELGVEKFRDDFSAEHGFSHKTQGNA